LGPNDDSNLWLIGEVYSFDIAADEQLIGAELYSGDYRYTGEIYLYGVTWLKAKIPK
jgi:hypothetical protein